MAVIESPNESERDQWLRERRGGIGASEVGTILGLNPYSSPYELWARKTGLISDTDETLAMWLGSQMEPIIARRYEMETGRTLIDCGDFWMVTHPDYPWLRATPDRLVQYAPGDVGAVELKTASIRTSSAWSDTDAPLTYQVQLQIQLACLDLPRGEIAALVGNEAFHVIPFERNDDFLDAVYPVLHEFWQCVQSGEPPAIDGTEATARVLKKLHPLDNGEVAALTDDAARAWHELQELKEIQRETESEIARRENILRAAIGDNTYGEHCGVRLLSYKTQERKGGLIVPLDYSQALALSKIPFKETKSTTYRVLRKATNK